MNTDEFKSYIETLEATVNRTEEMKRVRDKMLPFSLIHIQTS